MTFTHALSTNNYGTAKFIVSSSAANGTHTTIASALTSASSGDTIFIRPGTYTENLTLKAGVNLCAYDCDGLGAGSSSATNVIILGKMTATFIGQVSISGIELKTNGDYLIETTGSNAASLILSKCFLNCSNFSGIHKTNSSAFINLYNCNGNLGTTGIAYFVATSGDINFNYGNYTNTGNSTTASTISTGAIGFFGVQFTNYITTSSSGSWTANFCQFNGIYVTAGTGNIALTQCYVNATNSLAFSIGSGTSVTLKQCQIDTTNNPAISGAGTLIYEGVSFGGNANITASIQTPTAWTVFQGGTGLTSTTINQLLYSSSNNTIAGLTTANNGFLTTSATGVPSITSGSTNGASLVLISSPTASNSASLTFTGLATYQNYMLVLEGMRAQTDATNLLIQLSTNNGVSYISTGYTTGFNYSSYNSATITNVNVTNGFIVCGPARNAGGWPSAVYFLYDMLDGANFTNGSGQASFITSSNVISFGTGGGNSGNFAAVNAIQVLYSSGNIVSGRVSLYGIKTS